MYKPYNNLPYPLNLWSTIHQKEITKEELPADWENALEHVLTVIPNKHAKNALLFYYRDDYVLKAVGEQCGFSVARAKQIIDHTITQLRMPQSMLFLDNGLSKALEMDEDMRCNEALTDSVLIEFLGLSNRTYNGLRRAGIKTIGELKNCSDKRILRMRSIGESTLNEIHKSLSDYQVHQPSEDVQGAPDAAPDPIRDRLIADISAIRSELSKNHLWASNEKIANYLLSRGWTLPTRCGSCSLKFEKHGHSKAGCPLDGEGLMRNEDYCSCGQPSEEAVKNV